jgi:hypothetical protein
MVTKNNLQRDIQPTSAAAPDAAFLVGTKDEDLLTNLLLPDEVDYLLSLSKVRRLLHALRIPAPSRVDKLGKKVRDEILKRRAAIAATKSMWQRVWTAEAKIRAYFQIPNFRMIVHVNGKKGNSGKTIVSLYLGSWVQAITGEVPVLLAATEARTNNTVGRHVGVPTNSPLNLTRHSKFTEYVKTGRFSYADELLSNLYLADCGVRVILEDQPITKPGSDVENAFDNVNRAVAYPPIAFRRDVEGLLGSGVRCLFLDGAQDGIEHGSIPHFASTLATAMLNIGNYKGGLSVDQMFDSLGNFVEWTARIESEDVVPRDGRGVPPANKVKGSVICLTDVPIGAKPNFERFKAAGYGKYFAVIHHDDYMYSDVGDNSGDNFHVVDRDAITEWTMLEQMELLLQLCQASAKTLNLDDSHIEKMATVTSGYHPQRVHVDDLGRLIEKPRYAMPKLPENLERDYVFSDEAVKRLTTAQATPAETKPEPVESYEVQPGASSAYQTDWMSQLRQNADDPFQLSLSAARHHATRTSY